MKRKVILYILHSLDGFVADSKGNVDWILGNNKNIKLELKDTKEENGLILGIYAKR